MITKRQIKAARSLVGFSQADLARKAGVSAGTINNIERGANTNPQLSTITSIKTALEEAGVEFIEDNAGT